MRGRLRRGSTGPCRGRGVFVALPVRFARALCTRDGAVIAFLEAGACQESSASTFNALPRPASVLVHGAKAEITKRAETPDDGWTRDVVPGRISTEPRTPALRTL